MFDSRMRALLFGANPSEMYRACFSCSSLVLVSYDTVGNVSPRGDVGADVRVPALLLGIIRYRII